MEAVPSLFTRSYPIAQKDSPTVVAGSMLRYHPIEAAMILVEGAQPLRFDTKHMFLSGYSILSNLSRKPPAEYYDFLFEPCVRNSVLIDSLDRGAGFGELLGLFSRTRLGFTTITDGRMFALVGMSDVLTLYQRGVIGSDMKAGDVASPVFSAERNVPLTKLLAFMLERRIRRVFLDRSDAYVSDRELVSYIFSPSRLEETRASPGALLQGSAIEVGPVEAEAFGNDLPLEEAAGLVLRSQGSAILCKNGVVSPWDIVMKPYLAGRMRFPREQAQPARQRGSPRRSEGRTTGHGDPEAG